MFTSSNLSFWSFSLQLGPLWPYCLPLPAPLPATAMRSGVDARLPLPAMRREAEGWELEYLWCGNRNVQRLASE